MTRNLPKYIAILGLSLVVVLSSFVANPSNAAEQSVAMSGWAWATVPGHDPVAGLGWISFNSANPGVTGPAHGVIVDTSSGDMSGTAWVLHGYTLSFNQADIDDDCPVSNPSRNKCKPQYNKNTHALSGWAKFQYEGDGGGWTGWLDLSPVTGSVVNGVVTFSGNAWGGDVAGNVSFTGVTLGDPVDGPFDYSLSNSGNIVATKGSSAVYVSSVITKTFLSGTAGNVNISVTSALPTGVSVDSISAGGDCTPTCSNTINFQIDPNATVGSHTVTVTGQPLGKTTSFTLEVRNSSGTTVTCIASPVSAVKVGQNVSWTATVNGGVPPYTYTWSGTNIPTSPAPTGNPYNITYTTVGQKTAQATVQDGSGATSVCNPAGTVFVSLDPKFEEF
jgi:hypothetical protein